MPKKTSKSSKSAKRTSSKRGSKKAIPPPDDPTQRHQETNLDLNIEGEVAAGAASFVAAAKKGPKKTPTMSTEVTRSQTMSITLTPKLRKEYEDLFASCTIKQEKRPAISTIRDKIITNRQRYEQVEQVAKVPWYAVATIHSLEGSLNFKTHLHNGDPLTAKTVHVPKGRPPGTPPFKWEESAIDALRFDNMTGVAQWNLAMILFKLEGFNGFGYRTRHPEVLTPYLWSFTNHYAKGKFAADRKFDPNVVSKQCGASAILKALTSTGVIKIPT